MTPERAWRHMVFALGCIAGCTVGSPQQPSDANQPQRDSATADAPAGGDDARSDGPVACIAPRKRCGSECVDTRVSLAHCGECYRNCTELLGSRVNDCNGGQCVCAAPGEPCDAGQFCTSAGCELECPAQQVCGSLCCTTSETCLDDTSCCASDKVCNTTCCAADQSCLNNACCPTAKVCDDACCSASQTCIENACCPTSNVCDDVCCTSEEVCLASGCCPTAQSCGSPAVCCPADETCVDGACCPEGRDCNGACCGSDQVCLQGTGCAARPANATVLYLTVDKKLGNMGGRVAIDTECARQRPAALASCGNVAAFLSFDANNQIADMPTRYSLDATRPLYWFNRSTNALTQFATSWADALDNSITVTVTQGTGQTFSTDNFWTGSRDDGTWAFASPYDYSCLGWTTTTASQALGTQGNPTTLTSWIDSTQNYIVCTRQLYVLCACKLAP